MILGLTAWLVTCGTLTANWLIGNKQITGWALALGTGALVSVYDVETAQWGFLAGAVIGIGIAVRNMATWNRARA